MSIYGTIPKGASRSGMSLSDLLAAGVDKDALMKRMQQMNEAEGERDVSMAEINVAKTGKDLRKACGKRLKAEMHVEYVKELMRIEPVAGPLYRLEEIKARHAAWLYARKMSPVIEAGIRKALGG